MRERRVQSVINNHDFLLFTLSSGFVTETAHWSNTWALRASLSSPIHYVCDLLLSTTCAAWAQL